MRWLLVSDEFKKFRVAKTLFYLAAFYMCGRVLMWSVFTNDSFYTRFVATFLAFGILGVVLTETVRATGYREKLLNEQSESAKAPEVQQKSSGPNSPNTNIHGNDNKTNIIINQAHPPQSQPGFHEKIDHMDFSLGGPFTVSDSIESLRKSKFEPFSFEGFSPLSFTVKGNTILRHGVEKTRHQLKLRAMNLRYVFQDGIEIPA